MSAIGNNGAQIIVCMYDYALIKRHTKRNSAELSHIKIGFPLTRVVIKVDEKAEKNHIAEELDTCSKYVHSAELNVDI